MKAEKVKLNFKGLCLIHDFVGAEGRGNLQHENHSILEKNECPSIMLE